jgi:hypothetical protein
MRAWSSTVFAGSTPISAELASPILERRRFAPTADAAGIGELDKNVAANGFGLTGPFVFTPGWQSHMEQLDFLNRI